MTPIESQHTEWKEVWRDEYLRWVCGFANAVFRSGEHRPRACRGRLPQGAPRASRAKRARQIETWGRGIERIFAACKAAGIPKPVLDFDGTGLAIEFRYAPEYLKAVAASGVVTRGEVTPGVTNHVGTKSAPSRH